MFRTLNDEKDEPLRRNFRGVETMSTKLTYHVNASGARYSTLLPIAREEAPRRRMSSKM